MKKVNVKQKERGITLIALVITVIVMLILAGVAINLTIGDNGIFKKSEEGAEVYKNSANDEASSLNDADSKMGELVNQYHEGNGESKPSPTAPTIGDSKGKKFEDTTTIIDKNKEEVPIPGGFTVSLDSSDDVNKGVIVVDANENEFVWVPVPDPTTMYVEETVTLAGGYTTTNRYSKLRIRSGEKYTGTKPGDATGVKEPDFLTSTDYGDASTEEGRGISQLKEVLEITGSDNTAVMKAFSDSLVEEYNAMIDSVIKYKGFYIGRYELTGTVESPTSKSGVVLTDQNWYSLKKACNNLINNEYVQSCMIYGCQWDETMSWVVRSGTKTEEEVNTDSTSWGNYRNSTGNAAINSGTKQNTGSNEAWKANNIYDLAGNVWEWTQEVDVDFHRIRRGGYYGSSGVNDPVMVRFYSNPYHFTEYTSSRPALILK